MNDGTRYDVKSEHGHYVLYVNGAFYGSYDTVSEASKEIETIEYEKSTEE